jgi:shikimate kinase
VIALGGGAWIEERNRDLIEQYSFTSIWLDAPFEVCWARIKDSDEERPLGKHARKRKPGTIDGARFTRSRVFISRSEQRKTLKPGYH